VPVRTIAQAIFSSGGVRLFVVTSRLPGLLFAALMLHLNFVGADLECARHVSATANMSAHHHAAMRAASQQALNAASAYGAKSVGSHDAPCEIPSRSSCCELVAPCSLVFASAEYAQVVRVAAGSGVVLSPLTDGTPSHITAPDPPPPKA